MLRQPAVSGRFYSSNPGQLRFEIENCFRSRIGPGTIPEKEGNSYSVAGGVVPHAGFVYSGHEAAWFYKSLFESGLVESVVIVGPDHQGLGEVASTWLKGFWRTPFGDVPVDEELAGKISSCGRVAVDEQAHQMEHSIEVQLPFLQYIYSLAGKTFSFVPVMLTDQSMSVAVSVGQDIARAIAGHNRSTVVIASTDFSHYISPEEAKRLDGLALERIVELDTGGLYSTISKMRITMCGYGAVAAVMEVAKARGIRKGRLLKYGTSGDVCRSHSVVGYGAVLFEMEIAGGQSL